MKKRGLSQEELKILACLTMLLDHIGAALVSSDWLRMVGRIAFPIYCFLLSEGLEHTQNPKKYGLRMGVCAILSEVPFDFLLFGGITLHHSSVMVTLLLGFCYGMACKTVKQMKNKVLLLVPFMALAQLAGSDYGAAGIAMIAIFVLFKDSPRQRLFQTLCLAALCYMMDSYPVRLGGLAVPIEMFAVLAMVPISCYNGRKCCQGKAVQWGFYLFYPVHMMALWVVGLCN